MNRKSWYHGTKLDFTSSTSLNILRSMLIHKININLNVNLVAYFVFSTGVHKKASLHNILLFSKHSFENITRIESESQKAHPWPSWPARGQLELAAHLVSPRGEPGLPPHSLHRSLWARRPSFALWQCLTSVDAGIGSWDTKLWLDELGDEGNESGDNGTLSCVRQTHKKECHVA